MPSAPSAAPSKGSRWDWNSPRRGVGQCRYRSSRIASHARSATSPRPAMACTPVTARSRAALDWGFALLSPPAQAALQAMSVFAGGCDLAAFAAVCHDDDAPPAIEVLDELVRTSFAVADHTGQRTRYRLLEPVRQFAEELLAAAGEDDARRQRHLRFFSDLARTWMNVKPRPARRRAKRCFGNSAT